MARRAGHLEGLEEQVKQRLVNADEPLHEVYPPTDAVRRDYEAFRQGRKG